MCMFRFNLTAIPLIAPRYFQAHADGLPFMLGSSRLYTVSASVLLVAGESNPDFIPSPIYPVAVTVKESSIVAKRLFYSMAFFFIILCIMKGFSHAD